MKNIFLFFFSLLFIGFISCTKSSSSEEKMGENIVRTINFIAADNSNIAASMNSSTLYAYYFKNSKMYKKEPLTLSTSNDVTVTALQGSVVYFISEFQLDNQVTIGQTTQSEFTALSVGQQVEHQNRAPLFVSGSMNFNEGTAIESVILTRGVARIDINTSADPLTSISRVVIKNAPGSTHPFALNVVSDVSTQKVYEQIFEPALTGIQENIFHLYETNSPVEVEVYGFYDNIPIQLDLEIPSVRRNKIYTIKVLNAGASIKSLFEVKEWEDGGVIEGKPDVSTSIRIDEPLSSLASGISIEPSGKEVHVSEQGGSFTLAFVSGTTVTLDQIEGQTDDILITPQTTTQTSSQGVITKFDLNISPQGKGRLPYRVKLHLRNSLVEQVYDYIDILIDGNKAQIETVTLGGVEWMAFNARSRNLNDQIYPLDGCSVEDMYNLNWIETVGGLFQWGRLYMYTPWLSGTNNQGAQSPNIPWTAATHVPCPDGYRIPTKAEVLALLPAGITIPGTYTYNGEEITTTLHAIPGTPSTPTNVGGTQRYVKFTSNTSGKTLIFPLSGSKGDKSTSNNPQFGHRFTFWTNSNQGAVSGWAWTGEINFGSNSGASATIANNMTIQAEAFAAVRCVKSI